MGVVGSVRVDIMVGSVRVEIMIECCHVCPWLCVVVKCRLEWGELLLRWMQHAVGTNVGLCGKILCD